MAGFIASALGGVSWKLGAIVGGFAAVGLGVGLAVTAFELRASEHEVAGLRSLIDDPKTGYVVRIAQAETNVAQTQAALESQNSAVAAQSAIDSARLDAARVSVTAANRASANSAAKVATMLATPLSGSTACDRYDDADKRLLGIAK